MDKPKKYKLKEVPDEEKNKKRGPTDWPPHPDDVQV